MPTSASQALRLHVALASGLLGAATGRVLQGPDRNRLLCAHLVLLHQIVRASVPLLEAARRQAFLANEDAVCRGLVAYLDRHIEEERHHDEWTLQDLAAAGITPAEVLAALPPASVAALVGAQYYWVLHCHPIALMGYIAMLEGNAPSPELIDRLRADTGLPEALFRTLRLHAAVDPQHRAALDDLLDRLPLDPGHRRLIGLSVTHTAAMLADSVASLRPWGETA
jgi:hypothetical protein